MRLVNTLPRLLMVVFLVATCLAALAPQALAQTVLFRVNAGGGQLTSIDAGPDWDEDSAAVPSTYHNSGSNLNGFPGGTIDPSVPAGAPPTLYDTERWDPAGAPEMTWTFPVGATGSYEVRLYMKNGFGGTSAAGQRVFDIQIEGNTVVSGLDLSGQYGHLNAIMLPFVVASDANLDITFIHGVENTLINAIEILAADTNGFLSPSPTGLSFGLLETATSSAPQNVTLNNLGDPGDQTINILSAVTSGDFSHTLGTPSIAPGGSVNFDVTFSPLTAGQVSETLTITHDGSNSPLTVNLNGEGFDPGAAPVAFDQYGLSGESLNNPTSLEFGPDDRLYVSQQNGLIVAYTIERQDTGSVSYVATATETINTIQNIPNHNDDGTASGQGNRQVTGLATAGTASNPVVYVTSSDPRISVDNDTGLDTNSGILSRLTWNGSAWDHVQMVRGLPRSEENHSSNGIEIDTTSNTLYLIQGGHTNKGAPGNNFSQTPEYALSAALLSVDLTTLEALPILVDGNGNDYLYDLPTLDDPSRGTPGLADPGDPFGGNNGLNQAIWDLTGPVQVYSPGFRNAYDAVRTQNGRIYTFDNGPNSGWGGIPINEGTANVTNQTNENGSTGYGDGLHFVSGPGYYGGHPNPTRANPEFSDLYEYEKVGGNWTLINTYDWAVDFPVPPVPFAAANAIEGDYQIPGVEDGSLAVISASTNGIDEYTASNFSGQLQGNILAASFNGNIYRFALNGAGDTVVEQEALFSGFGSQPLDVIAQGDGDIFPGSIWAATYGADNITIFEPVGGGAPCTGTNDPLLDEDNDGYTNADEIANGTDPCSGGSQPDDNDGDFVSDLLDDDDDNDGILDVNDMFAWDPNNGTTTSIPFSYSFFNQDPGTGFFGMGFTGLMNNGTDYLTLFDETNMAAGGASGLFTVEQVPAGDAINANNTQEYAFQMGIDADTSTPAFVVHTQLEPPFFEVGGSPSTPINFQSYGLYLGTGDQDSYLKIVMSANGGLSGIQVLLEDAGAVTSNTTYGTGTTGDLLSSSGVELYFVVDPAASTVQPQVSIDGGANITDLGAPVTIPSTWLDPLDNQGLALGLISTSFGSGTPFGATWDFLETSFVPSDNSATFAVTPGEILDASTAGTSSFILVNTSLPSAVTLTSMTLDLSTALLPDLVFDPNGTAGDTSAKPFTLDVSTAGVSNVTSSHSLPMGTGGFQGLQVNADGFAPGESIEFSIDVDPTSIEGTPSPGPNDTAAISGLELSGSTVTLDFSDGSTLIGQLFADGSDGGSFATISSDGPPAPGLELLNVSTPTLVGTANQVARITGPPGSTAKLVRVEAALFEQAGGGVNIDPFEANAALVVEPLGGIVLDGTGTADVPIVLTNTNADGGLNYLAATFEGPSGDGFVSPTVVVEYEETIPGVSIYRVNAGGPQLVAADASAPDWSVDSAASPSTYVNATDTGNQIYTNVVPITLDPSVPASVPSALFTTERYDQLATAEELQWDFPVTAGNDYEVRLFFAEIFPGAQSPAFRLFSVFVEGGIVLQDYDVFSDVGADTGVMKAFSVTPADNNLDIDFVHVAENPAIKGIEIVDLTAATDAQALIQITPTGNITTSTFTAGSLQITNQSTDGSNIVGVRLDLSTASLPDMVFDPVGDAGDVLGKCLTPDSGSIATGFVTPVDPCVDPFDLPHDLGYDAVDLAFTDFAAGETFTFSVDIDPTSIQGAPGTGSSGSVSGFELAGATVTVTFDLAGALVAETFAIAGSESGSQAIVRAGLPAAPGIAVLGATNPSVLADANQTVQITGPIGADVRLTVVEAALLTAGAPGGGFDLDPFEANEAVVITEYTATVGAGGTVDIPVVLTDSQLEGGFNYITAAFTDADGATGSNSDTWVHEFDPVALPALGAAPDPVAFGSVGVGSTPAQAVTLTHLGLVGSPDITVDAVDVVGANAAEFSTDFAGPIVLTPGTQTVFNVTFDPVFNGPKSASLSVSHNGLTPPLLVALTGEGTGGTDPSWLYRVNAGGAELTAIDAGPNWSADTLAAPSPYFTAGSNTVYSTAAGSSTGDTIDMSDPSIPATTPVELFKTERYDDTAVPEMQYTFPIAPTTSGTFEVRLYFADIFTGTQAVGARLFDVSIEGNLVLDDYDVFAAVGGAAGVMESFMVSVTDGDLVIDFGHNVENPAIKGIEILELAPTSAPEIPVREQYTLEQNRPNPFNPRTTISFSLKQGAPTSLRIYDVAGRLVRTLVDGKLPAGRHSYVWDGTDRGGRQVSTGVYYYRVVSDSFEQSKRMTLVK